MDQRQQTSPRPHMAECEDSESCPCPDPFVVEEMSRQAGILGFARLRAEAREERPLPPPANTGGYELWAREVLRAKGETYRMTTRGPVPLVDQTTTEGLSA